LPVTVLTAVTGILKSYPSQKTNIMHLIYFRYFLQLQMRIMSSSFVTWLKSFGEKKQKGGRVISLKMHPQHQPQRIRY